MRIDQLLSQAGYGSRKEVKQCLKKKEVCCNGQRIKEGKFQVEVSEDVVTVDGTIVTYEKERYYLFYKPKHCITATKDAKHKTVLDYIAPQDRPNLFPVGRLDKDTTGLLLLTTDGPLAHDLLAPKKHVEKWYRAEVSGCVGEKEILAFAQGVCLNEKEVAQPAKLRCLEQGETRSLVEVGIVEGKFHQVKRMFHAVGMEVLSLHRYQMGPLLLDEHLQAGQYRPLTEKEKKQVLALKER